MHWLHCLLVRVCLPAGRSAVHVCDAPPPGFPTHLTKPGKTYTVEGDLEGPNRGIIPRTVEDIFTYIVNDPEPTRCVRGGGGALVLACACPWAFVSAFRPKNPSSEFGAEPLGA